MCGNRVCEIQRALKWPFRPTIHDHACNSPGIFLFAEKIEDTSEIAQLVAIDHVSSAWPIRRHTHIQRPVCAKREAADRLVQLHGGNTYVENDSIDGFDMLVHRGKRSFNEPKFTI